MGWTGGQYSLYRAVLAFVAAWAVLGDFDLAHGAPSLLVARAVPLMAIAAALALAAGFRDRVAAGLLLGCVAVAELFAGGSLAIPSPASLANERGGLLLGGLLLLHVAVPRAPFGAFDARERVDPRGGWQRPAWLGEVAWALLLLFAAAPLVLAGIGTGTGSGSAEASVRLFRFLPELAAAAIGLAFRSWRPAAWGALLLWHLACAFAFGAAPGEGGRLLLILFAADPGAWSGRSLRGAAHGAARGDADPGSTAALRDFPQPTPARLFYDGDCGFCHRSVRFILAEELATPAALRLRFAALGGESFHACLARHPEVEPASLPDSIVLELEDGTIRTRSAAALEIASRLGGFWRGLALVGARLPSALLDAGYDAIARIRKKLFASPKDACPILPPDLRARFDA